jgi:hypothetical protein
MNQLLPFLALFHLFLLLAVKQIDCVASPKEDCLKL